MVSTGYSKVALSTSTPQSVYTRSSYARSEQSSLSHNKILNVGTRSLQISLSLSRNLNQYPPLFSYLNWLKAFVRLFVCYCSKPSKPRKSVMASALVSTGFPFCRVSCINSAVFKLQLQSNLKPFQKKTCGRDWQQLNVNRRDEAGIIHIPKALKPSDSEDVDGENVIEDTDDMFDDLLEKYGKVVYRSKDKKSISAEADDDAESLSFAVALAKVASEVKAADIRVLFVKPLVYWTRFFIIATAFSRPQIDAVRSKIRDLAEKQFERIPSGDSKPNSWTLLDFGDVVVHIFLPQQRAFYNLEEFYANATSIELPFKNQSSIHS